MRRPIDGRLAWPRIALFAWMLTACPVPAGAEDDRARAAAGPSVVGADRPGRRRAPGLDWPGPEPGWSGLACVALVLAACGGIAIAARRLGPRTAPGAVQVVGRVGLSPRHSVYLLRVGRRVLVVGAGPQGPPALIAELDELPADPAAPRREVES